MFGNSDRTITLKSNIEIKLDEIPNYFKDEEALKALAYFQRWQRIGLPYANWADCPNWYVELVDMLQPLDRLYNPPVPSINI